MKNLNFKIKQALLVVAVSLLLTSCGVTVPATKQDLHSAADTRVNNIIVRGNYQSLLKCWNDKANKISVDFANATQTQVYQDLGYAEITAGGAGGLYYLVIELRKLPGGRTKIDAFGNGYLGAKFVPEYVSTLKGCAQ